MSDPLCLWCGEPVLPDDRQESVALIRASATGPEPAVRHYECAARVVVGSVGHQMRCCSCYGGTEEDPPGLTLRESAVLALAMANTLCLKAEAER
jgi:hypothetical protein